MRKARFNIITILTLLISLSLFSTTLARDEMVNTALLWLNPASSAILVGDTTDIIIQLDDVTNVYAAELDLSFDHTILAVVDADPGTGGVQISEGDCPAPDFVVVNSADNSAGTISYAATQLNPTPACNGGTVATVELECLSAGISQISFTHSLISDPDGIVIDAPTQDATLVCNTVPYTPFNPTPAHNATDVAVTTDLYWEGGDPDPGDSVTYDVFFGTSDPPTTLLCDDTAATTCDPGSLNANTTYFWQVIATDNHGASATGSVWQFSTANTPPNTPFNPTPAHNATDVAVTTDLSWVGGDPDPGDSVTYDVFFGTSDPPTTLLCDDTAATSCNPGSLNANTSYFWQVIATDSHGASATGGFWQFSTIEDTAYKYIYLPLLVK